MEILKKGRAKANASLISIIQRFADIFIMYLGLIIVCLYEGNSFTQMHYFLILTVLVVFQMLGGVTDFYRSWRGVDFGSELVLVIKNWSLSIVLSAGILSLFQPFELSVSSYVGWYFIVCLGLSLFRLMIRLLTGFARKLGYNTRRVAIVGLSPAGINLAKSFVNAPWMGFIVKGYYSDDNYRNTDLEVVGNLDKLIIDARAGELDRIYIALPMSEEVKIKDLIDNLADTTCSVMMIPDIFTFNILQSRHEEINGIPILAIFETPMSGVNMMLKRIEDVLLSAIIILFISPVILFISLAIKFTSTGPVFFRQLRYGLDGKAIVVWKFRTMTVMENDLKVVQAKKGDSRITPLGGFLRKTSLDELPQFFNVLIGDMSIVGPRPHAIAHNELYRKQIKGYMLRHKMKPGITGWAQINGWRGETDTLDKMEKRIEYDLEYIRSWSVYLDLKIIFLTVFKGFVNEKAY